MNPRKRRYARRNPNFMGMIGLSPSNLRAIGYTATGFVATPFVEGFAAQVVPAVISQTQIGKYAVKIASALGVSFIVRQVFGREAGKEAFIGGAAYVAVGLIQQFVLPAVGMVPAGAGEYLSQQPLLSGGGGAFGMYPSMGDIQAGVPDRLNPANRF